MTRARLAAILVLGVSAAGATRRFAAGGYANLVATGAGHVWTVVANGERVSVVRIDPRSGRLRRYPYEGSGEARIRVGHGAVWLADPQTRSITRLDLHGGDRMVTRPFPGGAPRELAVGPGGVWAVEEATPRLVELNPATGGVRRLVRVPGAPVLADVAVDADHVWLTTGDAGELVRVATSTGRMVGKPAKVGATALDVEVEGGEAWIDLGDRDALAKVDAGGRVAARAGDNGGDAFAIAVGFGSVWVTNYGLGTVTRIDARTGAKVGTPIRVGRDPKGVAAGDDAVWVANAADCTITAIAP